MRRQHLIRVGAMGLVGRFTAVDAVCYPRGARVVLRTARGLELGDVLTPLEDDYLEPGRSSDGSILRGVTPQDHLLLARLEKNRQEAFAACSRRLAELGQPAALMEVEPLFDGRTLLFYFLGEMTSELEALTEELAELYEMHVQFRRFGETLEAGCGPACGTEEAGGCKTCVAGCAVAGACATKSSAPA